MCNKIRLLSETFTFEKQIGEIKKNFDSGVYLQEYSIEQMNISVDEANAVIKDNT